MKDKSMPESTYGSKTHWEKDLGEVESSDPKYSKGQFSNPRELKESADDLARFAKKKKMKY